MQDWLILTDDILRNVLTRMGVDGDKCRYPLKFITTTHF